MSTADSKAFDGTEINLGTKLNYFAGLIALKNGPTEVYLRHTERDLAAIRAYKSKPVWRQLSLLLALKN